MGLDGTDLLIEAGHAPPPELLDALLHDKREILALLRAREAVEVLSPKTATACLNLHGLTLGELKEAAVEDWPEVRNDQAVLEALAHAIVTRRQRERGECPPHWTERGECAGCGSVFLVVRPSGAGARLPLVLRPRRGATHPSTRGRHQRHLPPFPPHRPPARRAPRWG